MAGKFTPQRNQTAGNNSRHAIRSHHTDRGAPLLLTLPDMRGRAVAGAPGSITYFVTLAIDSNPQLHWRISQK